LENVKNDQYDRKQFWRHLLVGVLLTLSGLWLTYFSYLMAIGFGSLTYYVFWGIAVVGLVVIAKSFILFWRKS
jgi:hypothetical protein